MLIFDGVNIYHNKRKGKIRTMAKRRTTKHGIHSVCTELWAECVAMSLYAANADPKNVEALLHSILKLEKYYISRVSHLEPGMKPKLYFKDLSDKFVAHASELSDQVSNLC